MRILIGYALGIGTVHYESSSEFARLSTAKNG